MIGIILLIGIVKKNRIMMLTSHCGANANEGSHAGCDIRGLHVAFRPYSFERPGSHVGPYRSPLAMGQV